MDVSLATLLLSAASGVVVGLFLAVWLALPLLRGGPPPDRD